MLYRYVRRLYLSNMAEQQYIAAAAVQCMRSSSTLEYVPLTG